MSNARFSILQSRAVADKRISNAQFRTLAALGSYGDADGWCYPKLKTLGESLNKSKQAVSRDLLFLAELGYVEIHAQYREDGSRQNNLYRLKFDTKDDTRKRGDDTHKQDDDTPSTSEVDTPSTSEVDALTTHINAPIKDSANAERLPKPQKNKEQQPPKKSKKPWIPHPKTPVSDDLYRHFMAVTHLCAPRLGSDKEKKAAQSMFFTPIDDIADLVQGDAEQGKRLISDAVNRLTEDRLTIANANSILKTAQAIYAEGFRLTLPSRANIAWETHE